MSDPLSIAQAYIATWNATDPAQRRALLDRHWSADACYADPMMNATSAEGIGALVAAVHQRFEGFRFTLLGTPDGHGEFVRLAWSLGPDGAPPPVKGSDVVVLREGRIRQVIGFIDQAPAAA
ncbi:MAG: nuclear transport factor 2 family protein [Ramlibacter sp.]|nr:nuclear transport factor 2 family protein [Ramlibacter sp.]MCW5648700.1 nuclear transport factor 2 family protein [Ramlibacter sp.]